MIADLFSGPEEQSGKTQTNLGLVICVGLDSALEASIKTLLQNNFEVVCRGSALEFYGTLIRSQAVLTAVILTSDLPDQPPNVVIEYIRSNLKVPVIVTGRTLSPEQRLNLYVYGAAIVIPAELTNAEQRCMLEGALTAICQPTKQTQLPDLKLAGNPDITRKTPQDHRTTKIPSKGDAELRSSWNLNMASRVLSSPTLSSTHLTQKELRLLQLLIKGAGQVHSREALAEALYSTADNNALKALDAALQRFRRKALEVFGVHVIATHYGEGIELTIDIEAF